VLLAGNYDRAGDYLAEDYVEHHGQAAPGPDAFASYLSRENVAYSKVHHRIADGNYVFALSEGTRGTTRVAFYDLFRVQGGKFVEHWDSRRSVPSSTASGLGIF
jgi:predicted SnoaL-like aldol condensation-catalyzing enzyme